MQTTRIALAAAALVFLATSAHAQIPMPGQSTPQLLMKWNTSSAHGDGTYDYEVYLEHYGTPNFGSTGYWLSTYTVLAKYNGRGWTVVNQSAPFPLFFANASTTDPNGQSPQTVNDFVAQQMYGPGFYQYSWVLLAYNPVNGATVPWQQSAVQFHANY